MHIQIREIISLRKKLQMTGSDLSKIVNPPIPLPSIRDWERGAKTPPAYVLAFILKELKHIEILINQLKEGDLSNATLANFKFKGESLRQSLLTECTFRNIDFSMTDFSDSQMLNCNFYNCKFKQCLLNRCDLAGTSFKACDFTKASLTGAHYTAETFIDSHLENVIGEVANR